jgi:sugar/nucleoside kinase (ribokinase family)
MSDAAHQMVFHHLGATAQFRFEDIPQSLPAGAEVLLASSFPIMPQMRVHGYAQALAITRQAAGITALDIGPAIGAPVTLAELAPLLPDVDYLIANQHELAVLTGTEDLDAAGQQILAAGAKFVVLKRGKAGASVFGAEIRIAVPGFQVPAKQSVGAGDSFNVGFLYGVQQGWPLEQALRFGNAVAALVVSSRRGVLDSPTLAAVEEFLHEKE